MKSMIEQVARVTLFLICAGAVSAQVKVAFQLKLQPGAIYTCTMDIAQTVTQTVDNEEQTLEQDMLTVWQYQVLKQDKDGVSDVNLTYERVKISQDYGHEASEYDSDNPPDYLDPSMRGIATLPGTELALRITSDGEVVEVRGIDEMLDRMIAAMNLPDTPQKEMVVSNLRQQFGADAFRQQFEQITSFYPLREVAVGDRWESTQTISAGFPMTVRSLYILKSRQGGKAYIDVSSAVTSDPKNPVAMGQLTMAYEIGGTQKGEIVVEEASGLPVRSDLDLESSGNVRVSGVPGEEAQTWPLATSGSVIVTFERQPD
jgi:hypothetical protein